MNLRVVEIDGESWFVAKDVCAALSIGDPSMAMARLEADEKAQFNLGNSAGGRGNPNVNIVSESGLYALILRSRKPEAKAFRKWVTSEVLPSIRKHGMYMTQEVAREAVEDPMSLMARALVVANEQLGVKTKQAYGLDPASDQEGPPD
ncbi:hypothetical protein WJ63_11485 [Burkholderia pyrrocinia]|nr:hypothetical protein WJ63_11485 [Burkholderia pyrrocinia]